MLRRFFVPYQPKPVPAFPFGNAPSSSVGLSPTRRWRQIFVDRRANRNWARRLLAVVYADVVGYSRLFRLDDAETVSRLRDMHRRLTAPAVRRHGGRLVQTAGDSMLITFNSITGAVQCATNIQYELAIENERWPQDRKMQLRVGVDLGDVIAEGRDFHGDGVIVAVRLQEICPPGGVCISRAVYDRGGNRLGLPFEALGPLTLKNIGQPVDALVLWPSRNERSKSIRLVR